MTSLTYLEPAPLVLALPIAAEPVWDPACQEWVLTDSDGIAYCGGTPSECYRQFIEALHYLAEHLRKTGCDPAEFPPYFVLR